MEKKEGLESDDFKIIGTLFDGSKIEFLGNIILKENPIESYIEIGCIMDGKYMKIIIGPTTTEQIDTEEEFALFQIFSNSTLENQIWENGKNDHIKEFLSRKFNIYLKNINIQNINHGNNANEKFKSDILSLLNHSVTIGLANEIGISVQEFVSEVKRLVEIQNISKPSLIRYTDEELEKKFNHSMVIVGKNQDGSKTLLGNISYEPSHYSCLPGDLNIATSGTLIIHPYLRGIGLGKALLNTSQKYYENKYDAIIGATFNPIVYKTKLEQGYIPIKSMPANDYIIPAMHQFYKELKKEPFAFITVKSYIKFTSEVREDVQQILILEFDKFKNEAIFLQKQIEDERKKSFIQLENI